jgi:hypothetical protein
MSTYKGVEVLETNLAIRQYTNADLGGRAVWA